MTVICKYCNKEYSSQSSRSNHIKKYHQTESEQNVSNISTNVSNDVSNVSNVSIFKCLVCNENFKSRTTKWRHEKICEKSDNINKTKSKNEEKIEKIEKEMLEYKKEVEVLKNQLQKALKIHPKTLNKINNQLNNHGTINNITIIQLGSENLSKVLNDKQKRFILDRQAMSLNHLVDLIHVSGKYKKFQNVYITNLQSTFAYRFDEKLNKFIAVNKNELLTDIVDSRMYDIQKFYQEIYPELEPKKAAQIKKFIDRMGNEEDELKDVKKEEIKLILYNNREKIITEDIVI
jgi:hypothetical protein